jgi:hypothetical protein
VYTFAAYIESIRKLEVRAVGACLVPSLYGGADGTCRNGQVQNKRDPPLVEDFVSERLYLYVVELFISVDILITSRVLCNKSALANEGTVLF